MKKTITCILLTAGLTGYLSAQTPVQDKSDKNSGKVIRMDKQMFLDNIFDYTSGSTNWKYKGEKPAVIDFYATWCGPCRMVAPLLKSLAKEYKDRIAMGPLLKKPDILALGLSSRNPALQLAGSD